jgi:hypothetical protein
MTLNDTIIITPVLPATKFPAGQILITHNAADRIPPTEVARGLSRHLAGDWGELDPEDIQSNEDALLDGGRLLSAHGDGEDRFWIVSDRDRSVTTILLPQDH